MKMAKPIKQMGKYVSEKLERAILSKPEYYVWELSELRKTFNNVKGYPHKNIGMLSNNQIPMVMKIQKKFFVFKNGSKGITRYIFVSRKEI